MAGNDHITGGLRRRLGITLVLLTGLSALAGAASAHVDGAHGELTFHNERGGPATYDLTCEFWVEGHGMSHANGSLRAIHKIDSERVEEDVFVGEWNGTADGSGGWDFEAGPFTLPDGQGHYQFRALMNNSSEHTTPHSPVVDYTECDGGGDEPQPPSCPENLQAHAHDNGDIELEWDDSPDASVYHVYRATEDERFEHIGELHGTAFLDEKTEPETTYQYQVTAVNDAGEATDCPVVAATAIPTFPTTALLAIAAIGGVGAFVALRRWS